MSTELATKDNATRADRSGAHPYVQPRWDSRPVEDGFELRVWIPGVPKDGVEVQLVDDHLTIVGRRSEALPGNWKALQRELSSHDYRLRVRLNQKVDEERIHAHVEDGVLTLALPIPEEAKPRTIEIQ